MSGLQAARNLNSGEPSPDVLFSRRPSTKGQVSNRLPNKTKSSIKKTQVKKIQRSQGSYNNLKLKQPRSNHRHQNHYHQSYQNNQTGRSQRKHHHHLPQREISLHNHHVRLPPLALAPARALLVPDHLPTHQYQMKRVPEKWRNYTQSWSQRKSYMQRL